MRDKANHREGRDAELLDVTTGDVLSTDTWSPQRIAQALREGTHFNDRAFDSHLPADLRAASRVYWTPLYVARRAADWLTPLGVQTIVDVGSGAGKFCVAAAIAGGFKLTGLEQRPRLVSAARNLAQVFGVESLVTFIEGAVGDAPMPSAHAYYFYNPFGENLFCAQDQLDSDVELGSARHHRDVSTIEAQLLDAPLGTYVLTYNGFGGLMPSCYREVHRDNRLPNTLQLSQKVDGARGSLQ
jgi:SAM-dependent methyltransferase